MASVGSAAPAASLGAQVAVTRSQKLVAPQSASAQQLPEAGDRQTPALLQIPDAHRTAALLTWQVPSPGP
jgi:hypothetical protein